MNANSDPNPQTLLEELAFARRELAEARDALHLACARSRAGRWWMAPSLMLGAVLLSLIVSSDINGAADDPPPVGRFRMPFIIEDGNGKEVLRVLDNPFGTSLEVDSGAFGKVVLGVVPYTSEGDGTSVGLHLVYKDRPITTLAVNAAGDAGYLQLGDFGGPHALLGVGSQTKTGYLELTGEGEKVLLGKPPGKSMALRFNDRSGMAVAEIGNGQVGGRVEVKGQSSSATLEQPPGKGMGLRVFGGPDFPAASIGIDGSGHGRMLLGGTADRGVIGLWADASRGSINVFGDSGQPLVSMNTTDFGGDGLLVVRNDAGLAVAHMTGASQGGGGNVTLADPSGQGIFSAGWNGEEGIACANMKTGMWCMGKNLPLEMH